MKKFEILIKSKINRFKSSLPALFAPEFLKDKVNQTMFAMTAILYVGIWVYTVFNFRVNDFLIPIKYNSFLGVTELGGWYTIYKIPFILTFCIIINLVLGDLIYKKDRMLSYILVGVNIFLAVVSTSLVFNFAKVAGTL